MQIDFLDHTNSISSDRIHLLEEFIQYIGKKEQISENKELSITFVNDEEIRAINKAYRQKDEPTDVISFALLETDEDEVIIKDKNLPVMLGDIIISVDKIKQQSISYGHSFKRELGFLVAHGLLHLLGYNHLTKSDEMEMFQKQNDYLKEFGFER